MKLGVSLSSAAHVILLTWGLWSLSAPTPLMVADVEALPIDIVPIEEITQSVEGDKKAKLSETPAPVPTQRPKDAPDAKNIGQSENDQKSQPAAEPEAKPIEVAKTEAPPPAPVPTPSPRIEPEEKPVEKDIPAPTTEVAPVNKPVEPVKDPIKDIVEEAKPVPVSEPVIQQAEPTAETGEQFASLEKVKAVPTPRPQAAAAKPQIAETSERKKSEEPAQTKSASSAEKKSDPIGDITKALKTTEKPAATGAKSSTKQASLGTSKPSSSGKLSTSEIDALRSAIEKCWNVPSGIADAADMRATVTMSLLPDGTIEGRPSVSSSGGDSGPRRAFEGSVVRAVARCAPYSLPKEKYDTWSQVEVNFSAADMF